MSDKKEIPKIQRVIAILWPSFLTSGVAMTLFYWVFSPDELFPEHVASGIGHVAMYSTTFFFLWLTTATSCVLTCYFLRPCHRCND